LANVVAAAVGIIHGRGWSVRTIETVGGTRRIRRAVNRFLAVTVSATEPVGGLAVLNPIAVGGTGEAVFTIPGFADTVTADRAAAGRAKKTIVRTGVAVLSLLTDPVVVAGRKKIFTSISDFTAQQGVSQTGIPAGSTVTDGIAAFRAVAVQSVVRAMRIVRHIVAGV
jgi:hypothetical protein